MKFVHTQRRCKKKKIHNITNSTRKNPLGLKLCGKIISDKEGWKTITIYGDPFERGFCHGFLLKNELQKIIHILPFIVKKSFHINMQTYLDTCKKEVSGIVEKDFNEFFKEIEGISAGAKANGLIITVDFLIAWNCFLSMYNFFNNKNKNHEKEHHGHCSAFIAVGNSTESGDIIMAHSTHCD
jgi:hypothetical protein